MFPLLLLCLSLATAAPPRIKPSQTSITIDKGKFDVVEFTLDEPIICKDMGLSCSVTVLLTNPNPSKISMDNCMVKWNWDEWSQPRHIRISAVENFINDKPFTGTIVMGPAISRSDYYNGYRTANITVATIFKPSGYCSGTGDPHYTTFDGAYWHVYWAGAYVLYAAPHRGFEVQVAARGYPAQHCGFAVRENNDVVVVYRCDGNNIMRRTCATSGCNSGSFPKISVSGSSYRVDLESGALVRFDMYNSVYGNMYVTAPGQDYGATQGICGNFNGNSGDDVPVYVASSPSQMPSTMIPKYDLFNWKPSASDFTTVIVSPYAKECNYTEPTFIRPILSNPDVEDITNLIKNSAGSVINNKNENFVETKVDDAVAATIEKICSDAVLSSHVSAVCTKNIPGFDVQPYIDGCVEDLVLSGGNKEFIERAIEDMENKCIVDATRDTTTWEKDNNGNPVEPNIEIQNNLCPNKCSGNGECIAAKCRCYDNFQGVDCGIDVLTPPTIESQSDYVIDTTDPSRPREITVFGKNFYNSDSLACKIGDTIVPAFYMGSKMILCNLPLVSLADNVPKTYPVLVTTDSKKLSQTAGNITFYNSLCHVCSPNSCGINPNSCNIGGVCNPAQKVSPNNVCMRCLPKISVRDWSYNYDNILDCGPIFELASYNAKIVERNSAGNVFTRINANNPNMAENSQYFVSYKLVNSESIFAINKDGGIYTVTDLDANKLAYPFNNMITVMATDNSGNVATTHVIVNILKTNTPPLFEQDIYVFNVSENVAKGSKVGTVLAKDSDVDYDWGKINYDLMLSSAFTVDKSSGILSTASEIDYEDTQTYEGILTAKDGGGQFHMTKVIFNVIDINEPPTDVLISANTLNENMPSGTVVGKLGCVDPERNSCSFSVVNSSDFKVLNNNILYSNKTFNYESQSKSRVSVRAFDGLNAITKMIEVNILDINDAPVIVGLSSTYIRENEKVDSAVAVLNVTDEDVGQSVRCIVTDNSYFSLQANMLILNNRLDYMATPSIPVEIVCVDDGTPALYANKKFIINVVDTENVIDISKIQIKYFPVYENIKRGYVVANIISKDSTFISRNSDFIIYGNNLTYVGNGLDYEREKRVYVILDATGGSISLTFDVINVFDAPTGIEWSSYQEGDTIMGEIYVVGDEPQSEYSVMLQSHIDKFALKDKTLFAVVVRVPAGKYVLDFIVNEEYKFSLELVVKDGDGDDEEEIISTTMSPQIYTIEMSDDENFGTSLGNIRDAIRIECGKMNSVITVNSDTGRIYTIGVPSANNITTGKHVCKLLMKYTSVPNTLVVYVKDGCYDLPCGNNACIDVFKSHICNCNNGYVGEKCDDIEKILASSGDNSNNVSKSALIGIIIGTLLLVAIILILVVVVFKKPSNKTSDNYSDDAVMMTNPIFISPSNRNIVVTNATYDYLGYGYGQQSSLNNPMYAVNENSNPMYAVKEEQVYSPELPLKMNQKDMVRSLANEETSELYGNVADAKSVVIHDLTV